MNRKFNVWWLPLARRVVGWGAAGALLWGFVAFAVACALFLGVLLWETAHFVSARDESDRYDSWFWAAMLYGTFIVGLAGSLLGLLVGIVAGFCAPPVDVKMPHKSPFFRSVNRQTFWFWFITSTAGVPSFSALIYFGINPLLSQNGAFAVGCGLAFSGLLFGLGLWRAVNRALHAATPSNYNA